MCGNIIIRRFWEGPFSSKRACGVVLNRANSIEYRLSPIRRRRIGGEQVIKAEQRLGDNRVVKNELFAAICRKWRGALAPRPLCGAAVRRQEPSVGEAILAKQANGKPPYTKQRQTFHSLPLFIIHCQALSPVSAPSSASSSCRIWGSAYALSCPCGAQTSRG